MTGVELPALQVESLTVSYGGIRAVKDLRLHVNAGEIVALMGANGAGKTSTLKAIARLVASKGDIKVFSSSVQRLQTHQVARSGVALVPEGRGIFGAMTVRENLELGSWSNKRSSAVRRTLDEVVALFPRLGERMNQKAGTLSGGEQQMVAIGRAVMARPRIILLDEPSLGLAPKVVAEVFSAVSKIAAGGMTILLVEQNTRLALDTASRAYVLVAGELRLHGECAALKNDDRVEQAYLGLNVDSAPAKAAAGSGFA